MGKGGGGLVKVSEFGPIYNEYVVESTDENRNYIYFLA